MNEHVIGVGPHDLPWPTDTKYDPDLLQNGDRRNVLDKYRYWTVDAIKADLEQSNHNFAIAIENWQHDMNIGTIVRNANAFNAHSVHIIGRRHWNKRGAMVTDKYMSVIHHDSIDDFQTMMNEQERTVIAVDIVEGATPLSGFEFPVSCVLVFGGEGPGLSSEMQAIADSTVMIEQFGSTRSVNVGVASGVMMYEWVRQNILTNKK